MANSRPKKPTNVSESIDDVREAISALADAALPVVTGVLDAISANADKVSQSGKAVVESLRKNAKGLTEASKAMAVAGLNLSVSVAGIDKPSDSEK